MSEKIKPSMEHAGEKLDLSAEVSKNLERSKKEAERVVGEKLDAGELKQQVEQQAISGKEVAVGEKESSVSHEFGAYSNLKNDTYKRSLKRVQQRLNAPERALSNLLHRKSIDTASEALGKTVARPSGILGAGIAALIGSSLVLFMAKKYGFEYNFSLFLVLLAAGFALGIVGELAVRIIRRLRR